MLYLFLTMLTAYKEFGDELNFSKKDIDSFFEKYIKKNIIDSNSYECNERGYILLLQNNYISKEQFYKFLKSYSIDILIEDNNLYLICDDFDDILSTDYKTEFKILTGDYDWMNNFYGGYDPNEYWYIYNQETLESIINFCIKKGIEIDEELITKENTKIENGEIYFKDKKLRDFIFNRNYKENFEDLKYELVSAINDAQDAADYDECYNRIKRKFIEDVGHFEYRNNEYGKEKLFIKLNISLSEIEDQLKEWLGEYEFEDGPYGSIYEILNEMDYFKFQKPDYHYISGSIDNNTLNECTQDKLWL